MYGISSCHFTRIFKLQFIEKIHFPRYSLWKDIYKVKVFYMFLFILAFGHIVNMTDGMVLNVFLKAEKIVNSEITNSNPY